MLVVQINPDGASYTDNPLLKYCSESTPMSKQSTLMTARPLPGIYSKTDMAIAFPKNHINMARIAGLLYIRHKGKHICTPTEVVIVVNTESQWT